MENDPLYLTKNQHGVYYYRRPIVAEDQVFWRGPSGKPKREWNLSLRAKDRREAILLLPDAADRHEAERAAQYALFSTQSAVESAPETDRQREEREAREAVEAARKERFSARSPLRKLWRQRVRMTTAELTPEEAAVHDLL